MKAPDGDGFSTLYRFPLALEENLLTALYDLRHLANIFDHLSRRLVLDVDNLSSIEMLVTIKKRLLCLSNTVL